MKSQASAILAVGTTTATTRTLIDTITTPQSARMIVGIWAYIAGGAGVTTLENLSGIFDLDSPDYPLTPLQLPLDIAGALSSGAFAFSPRIFPANIPILGGGKVLGYVTLDLAQTIAHKARFGLIYE